MPNIQIIIAVGVAILIGLLGWRVHYLEREVDDMNQVIGKYKANVDELDRALKSKDRDIDAQNAAVAKIQAEGKARAEEAEKSLVEAKKRALNSERLAQDLLSRTPKSNDVCKEANDLLNEYLNGRNPSNVQPTRPALISSLRVTYSLLNPSTANH